MNTTSRPSPAGTVVALVGAALLVLAPLVGLIKGYDVFGLGNVILKALRSYGPPIVALMIPGTVVAAVVAYSRARPSSAVLRLVTWAGGFLGVASAVGLVATLTAGFTSQKRAALLVAFGLALAGSGLVLAGVRIDPRHSERAVDGGRPGRIWALVAIVGAAVLLAAPVLTLIAGRKYFRFGMPGLVQNMRSYEEQFKIAALPGLVVSALAIVALAVPRSAIVASILVGLGVAMAVGTGAGPFLIDASLFSPDKTQALNVAFVAGFLGSAIVLVSGLLGVRNRRRSTSSGVA